MAWQLSPSHPSGVTFLFFPQAFMGPQGCCMQLTATSSAGSRGIKNRDKGILRRLRNVQAVLCAQWLIPPWEPIFIERPYRTFTRLTSASLGDWPRSEFLSVNGIAKLTWVLHPLQFIVFPGIPFVVIRSFENSRPVWHQWGFTTECFYWSIGCEVSGSSQLGECAKIPVHFHLLFPLPLLRWSCTISICS